MVFKSSAAPPSLVKRGLTLGTCTSSLKKFTPNNLGAALIGWMSPDKISLVTLSGSNVVSLSDRKTGSSTLWTAPTTPRRPGWQVSGIKS